jgi:hypothetical protein
MGSFDELVDYVGLKFETFSEGDCHYARTDFIGLRSTEGQVKDCSVERFEFLMPSVVADANDGNLD